MSPGLVASSACLSHGTSFARKRVTDEGSSSGFLMKLIVFYTGGRNNIERDQERCHRFHRITKAKQESPAKSTDERGSGTPGILNIT